MKINCLLFILTQEELVTENWINSPSVIDTIILILLVAFLGIFIKRLNSYVDLLQKNTTDLTEEEFKRRLINLDETEVDDILKQRQEGFKAELNQESKIIKVQTYKNLLAEYNSGILGYSTIRIIGQSYIGSVAIMFILMNNELGDTPKMIEPFLVTVFCMGFNGSVLSQQSVKILFNLLISSILASIFFTMLNLI